MAGLPPWRRMLRGAPLGAAAGVRRRQIRHARPTASRDATLGRDIPASIEAIRVSVLRSLQPIPRFRRACVTAQLDAPAYAPWNSSRRAGLYVCVSTSESVPCSSLICFRRASHQRHLRRCGGTAIRANRPTAITGWSDSNRCRTMRLPSSRRREWPPAIYRQARSPALGTNIAISVAWHRRSTRERVGQPIRRPGRIPRGKVVLPRRIELPTPSLPRTCSTTELRQHRDPGQRPAPESGANMPRTVRQGKAWKCQGSWPPFTEFP